MERTILILDTETTGADIHSKVFLIATNIKIWEFRVNPKSRQPLIPIRDIQEFLCILKNAGRIVGHNITFDYVMLARTLGKPFIEAWNWNKVDDTLIMSHILDSSDKHDLISLVWKYLKEDITEPERKLEIAVKECKRIAKRKGWNLADKDNVITPSAKNDAWKQDFWLPRELALVEEYLPREYLSVCRDYAETDIVATEVLYKLFKEKICKAGYEKIYHERLKLLPIVAETELSGMGFSLERANELQKSLECELNRNKRTMESVIHKFGMNIAIPESGISNNIRDFMVGYLQIPLKRTEKGNFSLNRESLEQAIEYYSEDSLEAIFIKAMIDFRTIRTAINYLEVYRKFYYEGKLYPHLNVCGTKTLRWSCQNPNQQNVSKKEDINLRYVFGPPEGYCWYSFDAENIELRIPAYESQEEEMIEVFENPDKPPYNGSYHLIIASILWTKQFEESIAKGIPFKSLYPELYQWTKNGNFATIYGATDETIDKTYHKPGASRIIKERFKKLAKLSESIRSFAKRKGFVETIPDRDIDPKRGYPLVIPTDEYGRYRPTTPFNYHVQGTACWWLARAMVESYSLIKSLGGRIILQIHDEILVEIPKEKDTPEFPLLIKQKLESVNGIGVPIKVSYSRYANNWRDKDNLEE